MTHTLLSNQSEFVKQLVEALNVGPYWRRIIIDLQYNSLPVVYVEQLQDSTKLDLLKPDLSGAKIIREDEIK